MLMLDFNQPLNLGSAGRIIFSLFLVGIVATSVFLESPVQSRAWVTVCEECSPCVLGLHPFSNKHACNWIDDDKFTLCVKLPHVWCVPGTQWYWDRPQINHNPDQDNVVTEDDYISLYWLKKERYWLWYNDQHVFNLYLLSRDYPYMHLLSIPLIR